jgi:hypothetical protein
MQTTHGYNGWTNYETWVVNLWLTNDEGTCRYWESTAQEIYESAQPKAPFSRDERAALLLAEAMKEQLEEDNPLRESGLYTDLLTAALSEVNWYEIASHFLEDVSKEPTPC